MELHLVNTIDDAWAFKRWVGERRPEDVLGFDTETSGLNRLATRRLVGRFRGNSGAVLRLRL